MNKYSKNNKFNKNTTLIGSIPSGFDSMDGLYIDDSNKILIGKLRGKTIIKTSVKKIGRVIPGFTKYDKVFMKGEKIYIEKSSKRQ